MEPGVSAADAALPQTVSLASVRRRLEGAKNVYEGDGSDCLCDVFTLRPPMRLPWRYTDAQVAEGKVWTCTAVWSLDRSGRAGGEGMPQNCKELEKAVSAIAQNKDSARYSLLVDERGMGYSRARVGGDHLVAVDGCKFTFSVRRHSRTGRLCLLAVMHR